MSHSTQAPAIPLIQSVFVETLPEHLIAIRQGDNSVVIPIELLNRLIAELVVASKEG